jgi:hypothetical protein
MTDTREQRQQREQRQRWRHDEPQGEDFSQDGKPVTTTQTALTDMTHPTWGSFDKAQSQRKIFKKATAANQRNGHLKARIRLYGRVINQPPHRVR